MEPRIRQRVAQVSWSLDLITFASLIYGENIQADVDSYFNIFDMSSVRPLQDLN